MSGVTRDSSQPTNAPRMISRVLLADSHPALLHGLQSLLQEEISFEVVSMLTTASDLMEAVKRYRPDILLMDLRFKDDQGVALVERLLSQDRPPRVVILTAELSNTELHTLVRLGVSGVVLKEMPTHLVLQCLRSVHAGERWLERQSMALALEQLLEMELRAQDFASRLSSRELELSQLVAQGASNKAAAASLNLSEGSVRTYLHRIYGKLGISSRMELSMLFREQQLV